ncbi:MAG TPA: YihY/virulence factor BrkB family protein, partial [Planctomycetia bacterium]|nr:YihY/virulence factor BrkB family protein [Planctomycetia bacterium]
MTTADRMEMPGGAPGSRTVGDVVGLFSRAAEAWRRHNDMRRSAAVAMYTILSLSPLLIITIKLTAIVLDAEFATGQVARQAERLLGPQGAAAVAGMIAEAARPGAGLFATLVSLALLLFTASGVFLELHDSLNEIFGVKPAAGGGFWKTVRDRFLSMGMVFVVGFLLLVSQFVSTALTVTNEHFLGAGGAFAIGADIMVSTAVAALLFAALFRFLPDVRLSWRDVALGSVVTAVLFKIGQYLQALYFAYASTESAYGAAGSFVVVLLWVYYSCWIYFFGAELIHARAP